jgi:hypothetical protein
MHKSLAIIAIALIISVFTMFFGQSNFGAEAQSTMPFGGRMTILRYCECPEPGVLLSIGPPVGGVYFYPVSGSTLYMNYNIFTSGSWLLGLATPGGSCGSFSKGFCASQTPAQGRIFMVGTS